MAVAEIKMWDGERCWGFSMVIEGENLGLKRLDIVHLYSDMRSRDDPNTEQPKVGDRIEFHSLNCYHMGSAGDWKLIFS